MPRQLRLPFCNRITVRYISERQMLNIFGEPLLGGWNSDNLTIYVLKTSPQWEQIDTIYHELVHAVNDAWNSVRIGVIESMKREAAETARELEKDNE